MEQRMGNLADTLNGSEGVGIKKDIRPLLVAGLCLLAMLAGMSRATQPENSLLAFLQSLLIATFAAYWCVVDARLRGRPIVPAIHILLLCLWPIAVPVYLIVSRKWRGVAIIALVCVGWSVLFLLSERLSRFLVPVGL